MVNIKENKMKDNNFYFREYWKYFTMLNDNFGTINRK